MCLVKKSGGTRRTDKVCPSKQFSIVFSGCGENSPSGRLNHYPVDHKTGHEKHEKGRKSHKNKNLCVLVPRNSGREDKGRALVLTSR